MNEACDPRHPVLSKWKHDPRYVKSKICKKKKKITISELIYRMWLI